MAYCNKQEDKLGISWCSPKTWCPDLRSSRVLPWMVPAFCSQKIPFMGVFTLVVVGSFGKVLLYKAPGRLARTFYSTRTLHLETGARSPLIRGYIQGARIFGGSEINVVSAIPVDGDQLISKVAIADDVESATLNTSTWRARFVGQRYKQVCGQADVWGDGVVPEVSAHLEGAPNISLDGVYHLPVGSDDVSRP